MEWHTLGLPNPPYNLAQGIQASVGSAMGALQDTGATSVQFPKEENLTVSIVRRKPWMILALSVAVLIPCFWHPRIEAGDLASHVYNVWLAQLIAKGQAPGLYIASRWSNVLFDVTLLEVSKATGIGAGQKVVVSACVLIFFWGVFAFITAVTEHPPWFLTPCLAMLAYGYTFSMGFMNYYLSLGLACFALTLLWRPRRMGWIGGGIFALLTFLAHPIGFLWLIGMFAYPRIRARLPGWWRLVVPLAAVTAFYVIRWYASHRPELSADWDRGSFYVYNGADQLALYGKRYIALAVGAFCFGVLCVGVDLYGRRQKSDFWKHFELPFECYAITFCAAALLPENMRPSIYGGWIGVLGSRLTTISAILGICILAFLKPRRWHLVGFGACALVFFASLYQDTGWLNRLETNGERLTSELAPGTRVLITVDSPPNSRILFIHHSVERACIGHCFSYENYEPASGEFRVRVREGSPVVTSSTDDAEDMATGDYQVDETDLPLKQIYQCDPRDLTKLCIRDLHAGETNGETGQKIGSP